MSFCEGSKVWVRARNCMGMLGLGRMFKQTFNGNLIDSLLNSLCKVTFKGNYAKFYFSRNTVKQFV